MSEPTVTPPGFFKKLRLGNEYLKTWPVEKQLAPVFPENRIVKATRFGIRYMPPIAIFTMTWQIALGGNLGPQLPQRSLLVAYQCKDYGGWASVHQRHFLRHYYAGFMKFALNLKKRALL